METKRNEIRFYGIKPNKALKRQVERQIQKWLFQHCQSFISPAPESPESSDDPSFRVCIEQENQNCFFCHLQIQMGSQLVERSDVGKTVPDALSHTLQHAIKCLPEKPFEDFSEVSATDFMAASA